MEPMAISHGNKEDEDNFLPYAVQEFEINAFV